jgi:von Willebrand factor type A domain
VGATSGSSADPTDTTSQGTGGSIRAGTLTAGTWDDNLNYSFYLPYLQQIENEQVGGLPIIPRAGRLEIQVTDASGAPIGNAKVKVSNAGGQPLLQAPTRPDGKLFFFPGLTDVAVGDALQIQAALGAASATVVASVGDTAVSIPLAGVQATPADALDLAIVIDTTGSMGDELAYLQAEVSAISGQVAQQYPNVAQRLALIVYRDTGDEYVVRSFDFTSSVSTFQSEISAQSAAGGNDYPESPDKALAALPQLTWRSNAVARMAFWIADAPHHDERAAAMVSDFLAAQAAGIRLYPIAASGTNDLLEYTMRTAAEVTGGRYLFLTNDSGVGNDHKEPTIPCYQVTLLDKAMLRMIAMELTGTEIQPAPADVIRSTGDPHDGTCLLDDGQQVCAL